MSQSIFSDLLPTIKQALNTPQEIVCKDASSARRCRQAIYHQRKAEKKLFPEIMRVMVMVEGRVVRLRYTPNPILEIRASKEENA